MASNNQERLEEELAKIDPAVLRYFDELLAENAPAVRKVVQNVLDEPISQETQARLQKPLLPKPYQPRAPPRQRKSKKSASASEGVRPLPCAESTNSDRLPEERFWICSMTQRKKGKKRVQAGVSFDGASSEVWGET